MPDVRDAIPLPSDSLLARSDAAPGMVAEAEAAAETLTRLFAQFGIDARVIRHRRGPSANVFDIAAASGGGITQVVSHALNIAYALPDARLVTDRATAQTTIHVPALKRRAVLLGDLLDTPDAKTGYPLAAVLGADDTGAPVTANIAALPHLLIAGTTGSGKSTCLHAILVSLLARATPEQVRMLLIDTRGLELGRYAGIAHLVAPVAIKPHTAADTLEWAAREAQLRLDDLAGARVRGIEEFNTAVRAGALVAPLGAQRQFQPLPLILIAIDDLADVLRSEYHKRVEDALLQLATSGRTVGIHLVASTRHPQARALPPRIAAAMPARLSFLATESAGPTRDLLVGTASFTVPGSAPTAVWCPEVSLREIDAVAAHRQTRA